MKTLLLGPGTDHSNRFGAPFPRSGEELTVIDYNPKVVDHWKGTAVYALTGTVPRDIDFKPYFDEIHAYELFNLIPGPPDEFYDLWRRLWDALVPGGKVYATVPHWESRYIYAYPGPQRVYTPELIVHLDRHVRLSNQEDFGVMWPEPYHFRAESMDSRIHEGKPVGFQFVLRK